MRAVLIVGLYAGLNVAAAQAAPPTQSTDRCIDACLATQRTCVAAASTLADKAKCTKDNTSCSTHCPLPSKQRK